MKFESNESFKLNNNMNYHWLIDRSIWSSIIWHHEFFPYYHFSSLAICPPVAWFIMPPIHTFIHSFNQSIHPSNCSLLAVQFRCYFVCHNLYCRCFYLIFSPHPHSLCQMPSRPKCHRFKMSFFHHYNTIVYFNE